MSEKLTLKTVAEKLGVSRTSVSNAFNRPDQLSRDLRERIIKEAADLGYQGPNPAGRLLRTGKTDALGMIFFDKISHIFKDATAVDLMRGITSVCEAHGVSLLLIPTMTTDTDSTSTLQALVDGFIIYSAFIDTHTNSVSAALARSLPTVAIDQKLKDHPMVGIDDQQGAYQAAKLLTSQGHRNIAIMAFYLHRDNTTGLASQGRIQKSKMPTCQHRLKGYYLALEEVGIAKENVPIFETANASYEEGLKAAHLILNQPQRPTALLCMSDLFALAAMEVAEGLGLSVPQDLSIVGFDGIEQGQNGSVPLTTIRQSGFAKGQLAAKMLLGMEAMEDSLLSIEWISGKTVAPL